MTPLAAADLKLEEEDLSWKVRVIGLDSNLATWFAQGERTSHGWALDRIQFNVLDLKRDRSVQLLRPHFLERAKLGAW